VIGVAIILLVVLFPKGLVGAFQARRKPAIGEGRP
jgi:ABC-type branched-subunit amino acid transport system permease subunit